MVMPAPCTLGELVREGNAVHWLMYILKLVMHHHDNSSL